MTDTRIYSYFQSDFLNYTNISEFITQITQQIKSELLWYFNKSHISQLQISEIIRIPIPQAITTKISENQISVKNYAQNNVPNFSINSPIISEIPELVSKSSFNSIIFSEISEL